MNQSRPTYVHSPAVCSSVANRAFTIVTVLLGVGALSACADVSELTKTRVAASEVSVKQTQQTIGNSESGAVELQQAKASLDAAKTAMGKGEDVAASRLAAQAQLHADLASAQAQNAEARRGADEVRASTDSLRSEAERNTPTQR
jgi:hypothetical protein